MQHAHALELLSEMMQEGAHVLDVGSGSGYLTACMAMLVTILFDCHYFCIHSVSEKGTIFMRHKTEMMENAAQGSKGVKCGKG